MKNGKRSIRHCTNLHNDIFLTGIFIGCAEVRCGVVMAIYCKKTGSCLLTLRHMSWAFWMKG